MKTSLWLLAVTLLGIVGFHAYHAQTEQVATLRHELAALRAQQDRLAARVHAPIVVRTTAEPAALSAAEPSPPVTAAAPPPSSGGTDSEEAQVRRWDEDVRAHHAAVERTFAEQVRDESWAGRTRLALNERLATVSRSSGSSLRDIECRSTICRVEVVYPSADASRRFTQEAFTAPEDRAWNGPVMFMPSRASSDGSLDVVMYLAREGTDLLKRE